MSDRLAPLRWAEKEVGQAEVPGATANPRIIYYDSFTSLKATSDEVPWCSAFLCAAAENGGFESPRSAAARAWINYGDKGDGSIGDIAVFSRPGGAHVALIDSAYKDGDAHVSCLGGNQGDKVCSRLMRADRLLAIRRFPV